MRTGVLHVTDRIAATGSHTYTELLHADGKIQSSSPLAFTLQPVVGHAVLNAQITAPADITTKIEPNVVMGPGIPGSVDKGTPEQRGELIDATTTDAASTSQFHWILKF
jgi:hypothetical protein